MPSPFENAQLNLTLFDLRREPVLREAREWFVRDFNPDTFDEFLDAVRGKRNASFRMVLSYWNMAASLVSDGAISPDAFRAAHDEIFATFSKIHPHLAQLRSAAGEPDFCKRMEAVVLGAPDAEAILERRRRVLKQAAETKPVRRASASKRKTK
jgi:hypothetical protein